jgi:hypothetical protein
MAFAMSQSGTSRWVKTLKDATGVIRDDRSTR